MGTAICKYVAPPLSVDIFVISRPRMKTLEFAVDPPFPRAHAIESLSRSEFSFTVQLQVEDDYKRLQLNFKCFK